VCVQRKEAAEELKRKEEEAARAKVGGLLLNKCKPCLTRVVSSVLWLHCKAPTQSVHMWCEHISIESAPSRCAITTKNGHVAIILFDVWLQQTRQGS